MKFDLLYVFGIHWMLGGAGFAQRVFGIQHNNEVIPASESVESESDSHQQGNRPPSHGWSAWSDWSLCSRTCEGGIRRRLRRCLDKRCDGESLEYELCNVQSCPSGGIDFRTEQCGVHNRERYRNRLYDIWLPVHNRQEPCALMCKGKHYGFTERFSSKVVDGTKCNDKRPDVCIEGRCVEVGCDNALGSSKRIDDCGLCGGDGTTCGRPVFVWRDTSQFSECTKTCGPDSWRVSVSACFNDKTGRMVTENLCADKPRPRPIIKPCPHEPCPEESDAVKADKHEPLDLRWRVGLWHPCNVTCGGGHQQRDVFCVEHYNNTRGVSEMRPVASQHCWRVKKPDDWRACNTHQCPVWEKGEWSTCSVTCGKGVQYRKVACRQERYTELSAYACDPKERPEDQRPCYAGVSCDEAERNRLLDYERYRYVAAAPYTQWDDAGGAGERTRGALPRPHWSKGPWKECSTTCGPGVQTRQVKCVAIQPFTQTVMVLPSFECEDKSRPKPHEFQPCELRQCPKTSVGVSLEVEPSQPVQTGIMGISGIAGNEEQAGTRWEYGEWDKCSATCLGGYQSRRFKCVNVGTGEEVAWAECNAKQRPPANLTRQCATEPCPPQWQIGSWSVCSHTCGGGLRTRDARCIQIHRSGNVSNTLYLTDGQCSVGGVEPPQREQPCAMQNCPPYWSTGPWDECSRSCGDGQRYRVVVCEQLMVGGEIKRYNPPTPCNHSIQNKPPTVELCNYGPCPTLMDSGGEQYPSEGAVRETSTSSEVRQEYRFKVGGEAKVYEGSRLKIKCPVKDFDRAKITWRKDGLLLKPAANVKVSDRGALRIWNFTSRDAGVYTCYASGTVRGNITFKLKPTDARITPDMESQKQKSKIKVPIEPGKPSTPTVTPLGPQTVAEDGLVVEAPVDSGRTGNNMENGKTLAEELEKLKMGGQRDTMLTGAAVNGTFPRTSSLSLLEELERYLLAYNKLDVYQALNGVRNINDVQFSWIEGPWSPCSRTCRDGTEPGMQTRSVRCKVTVRGYETYVVEDVCVRAGVPMPHEANMCGAGACPKWVEGNWSVCSKGRCVRHHYAIIRRPLHCMFPNGSIVNFTYCSDKERPAGKSECWNPDCVAVWRAANWSACTKTCDTDGIRMRTVHCVWNGTRKAAGNRCSGNSRPRTVAYCPTSIPCPAVSLDPSRPYHPANGSIDISHCLDFSKYCPVAKMMGYCGTVEYRGRCCLSCSVLSDYKRHYAQSSIHIDPQQAS